MSGLLFLAAFLSGEHAAALLGYVLAIESTGPRRSARRRLLGLLPFLIPGAAVSVLSALLGYGTRSSGYCACCVPPPKHGRQPGWPSRSKLTTTGVFARSSIAFNPPSRW